MNRKEMKKTFCKTLLIIFIQKYIKKDIFDDKNFAKREWITDIKKMILAYFDKEERKKKQRKIRPSE